MGSVGEEEFQPSISIGKKIKFSRKFPGDCGKVPRKLRSVAIKKRGHESISPPLSISRKQNRVSNGVELIGKDGSKKSKLKMKQDHITKDEEEVAETLYALACMVPDTTETKELGLYGETSESKSSALQAGKGLEPECNDTTILKPGEEAKIIRPRVTLDAGRCSSNPTGSTVEVVKLHSSSCVEQPDFSNHSSSSGASGVQPQLSLVPSYDSGKMPTLHTTPSGELSIALEQVGIQNGKHHIVENKNTDLFSCTGLSPTGALSSQTPGSCLQTSTSRSPAWFDHTNYAIQPHSRGKNITNGKDSRAVSESKKSWKRCSAHVYISRLIKVLQVTERKCGLEEKPAQSTTHGGLHLGPHVSVNSQTSANNVSNDVASFKNINHSAAEKNLAEIQNAILLHKRLLQDQQQGSTTSGLCTSQKQGSDFLSLAAGVSGLDVRDRINRTGHSHEALKQFNIPYLQSHNPSTMLLSLPQNGYSSTFPGHTSTAAAQQIQLPPYLSSTLGGHAHIDATAPGRQESESHQQLKWTAQYHPGVVAPHFPNWQNGGRDSASFLNYAHSLFPHFQSSLDSNYKPISAQQQQQLIASNSSVSPSNVTRHHHSLPSGLERNSAAFCPESVQQLQLLCNQRL